MADVEKAVYARLNGYAGLTALVGAGGIYPEHLPQGVALPKVSYRRVSRMPVESMGSDAGLEVARVQVTAWAALYVTAKAVAEQVRAALQRYRGTLAGVEITASYLEGETDLRDDDTKAIGVILDFVIWYR